MSDEPRVMRGIQHRCPNMGLHMNSGKCACHPKLPIPCDECYSIIVTSERIAYRPYEPWRPVAAGLLRTDAEQAVIDAARAIKRAHDQAVGVPCNCSVCAAVAALDGGVA